MLCGDLNGKSKEEGIYVYMWLVRFAVQQKLTQNCRAAILQFKKQTNKHEFNHVTSLLKSLVSHCS